MGMEADLDWSKISGSATVIPTIGGVLPGGCAGLDGSLAEYQYQQCQHRRDAGWLCPGQLVALRDWRIGILGANTNVSTVGGVACTTAILTAVCSGTDYRLGATAGAGLEYGITPNLSAKVEYLYITAASLELSHLNVVRAGLNFRFGGI